MPKLKQADSLEEISRDSLVRFIIQFLEELNDEGSSEEFRQGISVIKDDMRDRMPRLILADFIEGFMQGLFDKICTDRWSESSFKASFELLMDVEIIGLSCYPIYLRYIDPQDIHRIRVITNLEFDHSDDRSVVHRFFENCHLHDLTDLLFDKHCTDNNLTLIGKNCPKLEVVSLEKSFITDEGLRALSPCRELRVVDITDCNRISHVGVNHLMSVHKNLKRLSFGNWNYNVYNSKSSDFLSRLEKPCSSIKCLRIKTTVFTDSRLRLIIEMFPGLSRLTLNCERVGDLTILKSLGNLSGIRIGFTGTIRTPNTESAWRSLQELLKLIGMNITTLEFSYACNGHYLEDRQGLNLIYEYCPNIEYFKFDFISQDLIVPPFKKLRQLCLHAVSDSNSDSDSDDDTFEPENILFQLRQFEIMLNLEQLDLINFDVDSGTVKSMMLDNKTFPELKMLRTNCEEADEVEVNRFARKNNIDFKILVCQSRNCLSSSEDISE